MRILTQVRQMELTGTRAIMATLAGAALTTGCAQLALHLPGNPVPVTMQVFAVVLCGLVLGSRLGAIAQLEYLAAGAAGLPVFAGFKSGFLALAGPTGGYLVAFAASAYLVGLIAEKSQTRGFANMCLAGSAGVITIYLVGRMWFSVWLGDISGLQSWAFGVAPFVCADAAKVVLAAAICSGRRDA